MHIKILRQKLTEKHLSSNWLHDVILGGQDGLVNVLGIVLGVSAANGSGQILIAASLAAAFAEAVSMGAVAYTTIMTDKEHFESELNREKYEIKNFPEREKEEVREIYRKRGLTGKVLEDVVETLTKDENVWLQTMMDDELHLQNVETKTVLPRSFVVGIAALMFSFIPIAPYVLSLPNAQVISLVVSGLSLFAVGVYEAKTYAGVWWKNGSRMLIIGMGAALAGFLIGNLFQVKN